jgi:hypothetical protein
VITFIFGIPKCTCVLINLDPDNRNASENEVRCAFCEKYDKTLVMLQSTGPATEREVSEVVAKRRKVIQNSSY